MCFRNMLKEKGIKRHVIKTSKMSNTHVILCMNFKIYLQEEKKKKKKNPKRHVCNEKSKFE